MCVQYRNDVSPEELAQFFEVFLPVDFTWKPHIFPRYLAPVVTVDDSERKLSLMHFGLIPYFEKEEKPKKVFHNARAETLAEKPSFKKSFASSRCLVPMTSFYEFLPVGTKKVLHCFQPKAARILCAAGLVSLWKSPHGNTISSFAIITREASPEILSAGHERCPVFLDPERVPFWLDTRLTQTSQLQEILRAVPTPDFIIEVANEKHSDSIFPTLLS